MTIKLAVPMRNNFFVHIRGSKNYRRQHYGRIRT
jgi:hypothetical protein